MQSIPEPGSGVSLRSEVASNLSYYLHVLRRRGLVILLIAAVVVGAGAVLTFRQHPVYRAASKIV